MSTNQEHAAVKLVWYASYGSNLKRERFMCYVKGGILPGSAKRNKGCFRDKNDPIEFQQISLNYELYFAGQSGTWGNGGVAFLRGEGGHTLGRMYLIIDEQFNDVVIQENSKEPDGSRFVPAFNQLVSQPQSILPGDPWYGKLLNMGSEGGWPILTFTTAGADLQHPPTAPSEQYVKVIASGIKETYPEMSDDDIVAYLYRAAGIRGNIDLAKISDLVAAA
jgi:hypothetical protein